MTVSSTLQIDPQTVTAEDVVRRLGVYRLLPQVAREVVIDRALVRVQCPAEAIATALEQFCQRHQIATEAEQQTWMAQYGLSAAELSELALREWKLEQFKQTNWGSSPILEAYFLKRKPQLDRATYGLLRTHDGEAARELYFRLKEGEASFAELARAYSEGPEASTGGLLGPVELGSLHPSLAQLLVASQPGQLQPPIQFGDQFAIVRLEGLVPAQLDETMRQRLIDEQFTSWLQAQAGSLQPLLRLEAKPAADRGAALSAIQLMGAVPLLLDPAAEPFSRALRFAMTAAMLATTARLQPDWQLVESHWLAAIALMQAVPIASEHHSSAQQNVEEYQRHLAVAQHHQTEQSG